MHLDGARIFNAAVALGKDVRTLTRGFATVMFCLSKGLGAPVGSMLVGAYEQMDRARNIRKALGGGMRQAGILAAAGLIALEEGPQRLHEDHANARMIAEQIAATGRVEIDLEAVRTNIVLFTLPNQGNAAAMVERLKDRGILSGPWVAMPFASSPIAMWIAPPARKSRVSPSPSLRHKAAAGETLRPEPSPSLRP